MKAFTHTVLALLTALTALSGCRSVYSEPVKVDEYLYEISYSDYDFGKMTETADFLFYGRGSMPAPACSAVRNGDMFGRNFDWFYDRMPEFVIRTGSAPGRFASIGVASPIGLMKDGRQKSAVGKIVMDMLPALTVDGINSNGVACCVNVVPAGDAGHTYGSNPSGKNICAGILVRYVLDNAESARGALDLIRIRNVYSTFAYGLNEEYHFMIADSAETFVVEFVDNAMTVLENEKIMTNFYLSKGPTDHANGIERYDILKKHYSEGATAEGMAGLLKRVWFSRAYSRDNDPLWHSEWCIVSKDKNVPVLGDIENDPSKVAVAFEENVKLFESRDRDTRDYRKRSWQSVHTSVYDLKRLTLNVSCQESGRVHSFPLHPDK